MGMQDKLLRQYIRGCNDTWDLIESAVKEIPGIGPKTHARLMDAIKAKANQEVEAVHNLRPAERNKLFAMIDEIGFGGDKDARG